MKIRTLILLSLFTISLDMLKATEQNKDQKNCAYSQQHSILFNDLYRNILLIMEPTLEKNNSLRRQMKEMSLAYEVPGLPLPQRESVQEITDPIDLMNMTLKNLEIYTIWFFKNLAHENAKLETYIAQNRTPPTRAASDIAYPNPAQSVKTSPGRIILPASPFPRKGHEVTTITISPNGASVKKTQDCGTPTDFINNFLTQMKNSNGSLVMSFGAGLGTSIRDKN